MAEAWKLSPLPDRHQLSEDAERFFDRFTPGIIFIDLDGFKTFNDSRGHEAGNDCLADVISIVAGVISDAGRLYRYGGDEFVVLFERADRGSVGAIAESIRAAIEGKARRG